MIINAATKPQFLPLICKSALLTMTFAIFALPSVCRAQAPEPSFDSKVEVIRADMRADKTSIITAAMNFNDKDGAAFWPIYREYDRERSMLEDGRVAVIKAYTEKYPNLTDADAKSMAERIFECDSRLVALKKIYYKKLNKVLPALTVTKFFQLDRRIDLMIDMKVESSLPPLTAAQSGSSESSD